MSFSESVSLSPNAPSLTVSLSFLLDGFGALKKALGQAASIKRKLRRIYPRFYFAYGRSEKMQLQVLIES